MSYQLLKQDILFYQRFLKANGFYPFKLDGSWGSKTDAADLAFLAKSKQIAEQHGSFDPRSESEIITLAPKAQVLARQFLTVMKKAGLDIRIISGIRTYAEQDALYRKGRFGSKEKKVTNAKGGQSNHNFGLAWDVGIFENGKYIQTDTKYKQLSQRVVGTLPNLEWGGNWRSFKDFPHYEHKATVSSIAALQVLFESGKPYV